ncbi:MAG TPA: AI-2E family transporter, partial [Saprospiraceae bacterium]|nr:AI-2E family transporter [Saprospiraceae bacterium]
MPDQIIHQNLIRQILFLVTLVLLGILLAYELYDFLPALLGAITLYVICRRYMFTLIFRYKWKPPAAAALLMISTFIIILIPIWVLVKMLTSKVTYAIEHANELVAAVQTVVRDLEIRTGMHIMNDDTISKLGTYIASALPTILGATFNILAILLFMYFILYFMLVNGKKMESELHNYVPMSDENARKLGKEMKTIVFSNAVGIPGVAFMQGVVAIIGYYILGVKEPWFWFVVTCITAMLPAIGAAFAFVPLAIIFFANDQDWQGVAMLIYGFGVIGTVDNIFRFTWARKIANVHPLITIFGVIIGIKLFGFVGLI